ncbi:MAG TPA: glycosyltransferase family 4 protein [Gemmatimonadales bacterium]
MLTFYYRPDLSAGSFRATALAEALRRLAPASHVDVITTLPNRYHSFTVAAPEIEEAPGLTVRRIALSRHRSGMVDQSAAFVAFARAASRFAAGERYDVIVATSSRLMTAALAARIARRGRTPLYLDIRDLFVDTITEVLPRPAALVLRPALSALERYAIGTASRVNVVSAGFLEYLGRRYPGRSFSCYTNGVDEEFAAAAPLARAPSPRPAGAATTTLLYAGNIGEGQGLHAIVPGLARAGGESLKLRIIGDGSRRSRLLETLERQGARNVELLPPMPRAALIEAYRAADVLFLHLNAHDAFTRVLPSKIFEYAAMGKPMLAGLSGFAARFVHEHIANAAVFSPCDADGAMSALRTLAPFDEPRRDFIAEFGRTAITERLARDVLALAG